ncbi:MAG TPA: tetratricopeptide repeat protein, partial [Ktedonobacteraceae bacterium]
AEAEQYYIEAIQTITHNKLPIKESEYETVPHSLVNELAGIVEPLHVARLLERVCECAVVQGNYEEARRNYECILTLRNQQKSFASEAESKQEAQIQALIWREIGRTWSANGFFDQAYECYQGGKQVMEEAGVTSGAAWACVHLEHGSIRSLQGNYDEARRFVQEALKMLEQAMQERQDDSSYEQTGNSGAGETESTRGNIYNSFQTRTERAILGAPLEVGLAHELLGVIAANVGQFAEALQQLHRALAIFEQHDLATALAQVYSNLGAVHAVKSENTMALTYMQRSLELAERIGNQPNIAIVTGNLGEMAARAGKLRQAEDWFRRSLAVAERTNEADQISWCNVALATALQDQGNLAGAAECIRRALSIARSMKSSRNIGNQFGDVLDLDASLAAGRFRGLEHFETRRQIDAVVGRALVVDRLLLRLHDVGQRGVARLVQSQVGRYDRRPLQLHGLQAAIDFARHLEIGAVDFELGGKGRLRPAEQGCQHLAGLVGIVVDRLLAENDQARLLRVRNGFQNLRDRQRFDVAFGL